MISHCTWSFARVTRKFTMANDLEEMDQDLLKKISKIVDAPFAEKVLRRSEKSANLQVHGVSIKPATSKGDNYASDMFRVTVEYTRQNGKLSVNEKKSLIVKVEPLTEGTQQDLISKSSAFPTEISMMTDALAQMNELLGSDSPPLNGRALYTQRQNPPLLVIEDLAPLGFRLANRITGLDMDHCLLAIRNLARFHASSVALLEKDPSLKSTYSRGIYNECQPPEIRSFFEHGFKQLGQEIASWPEIDSRISEKILKLADTIYERGCVASSYRENEFIALNHGDFWVNNMLFKYNESNKPVQHIFVDFQVSLYTSPAVDLNYFFNTSLTDDTLILYEETLLHEYTRTLALTMTQVKCTTKPPSLEEIKVMMREHALIGVICAVVELPIMMANKDQVKDSDEVLAGMAENPVYQEPLFRKALIRRLPMFDQMGLLD